MIKGIDISRWQGNAIDFKKVKNDVYFVMIRATCGCDTDKYFEQNYKAAKEAGLKVGCYFFGEANTIEGLKKEIKSLKNVIKNKSFDLPICYDVEYKTIIEMSKKSIQNLIKTYINEMKDYDVCVYTSKSYADKFGLSEIDVPAWVAQWNTKCTYKGNYFMWQYSDCGKVNGIDGRVDLDYIIDDNYFNQTKTKKTTTTKSTDTNISTKKLTNAEIIKIVDDVISGKYGNGDTRKKALGKNYELIQKEVNTKLKAIERSQKLNYVKAGAKLTLKNVPLYSSSSSYKMVSKVTGTYYLYDSIGDYGRYRITNSKDRVKKTPVGENVTGYINLTDVLDNISTK